MFLRLMFCFAVSLLTAETIETFYGPLEVEEPVLLELIRSPAMQRLKGIHQYGVAYYTTHREEFYRYDHSIGVFAVLRTHGAGLKEQIAGLLHDVSHTVFSHVGDWIFGKEYQENDYQNSTHRNYLISSGVDEILLKYGIGIDEVSPKNREFMRLEQPLPNLCADRIDYNLQGAFYQGFLSREEARELFDDLQFVEGRWVTRREDLAKKISQFALFMTEDCWGNALNYANSKWLADAILRGIEIGLLSWKEIHFGLDQEVWDKLAMSGDEVIEERMRRLTNPEGYFWMGADDSDLRVPFRCRGIDPWIWREGDVERLSAMDLEYAAELRMVKERAAIGWSIRLP
ncbi:MAG TPA: HD domain-containing protein [Chlamydiales bacterium]|nr:HD domain-containing protein [Chlamydiales bacterium]